MYGANQIVWHRILKRPVNAERSNGNVTHFIRPTRHWAKSYTVYEVFLPKSIADAKRLLDEGVITPAAENGCITMVDGSTPVMQIWERDHGGRMR